MREIATIGPLDARDYGDELISQLASALPNSLRMPVFLLVSSKIDEIETARRMLAAAGAIEVPFGDDDDPSRKFSITWTRRADEEELSKASFVTIQPTEPGPEGQLLTEEKRGTVRLSRGQEVRATLFARGSSLFWLASPLLRKAVDAERFGIRFEKTGIPRWQMIRSDVRMPPVSDVMLLRHYYTGAQEAPGFPGPCGMRDDPKFLGGCVLHYRKDAFDAVGEFHIAESFEQVGPSEWDRYLVISQELRAALIDAGVDVEWLPVVVH